MELYKPELLRVEPFNMNYLQDYFENEYEIIEQELEKMTTDSGKELELQGYIMRAKGIQKA